MRADSQTDKVQPNQECLSSLSGVQDAGIKFKGETMSTTFMTRFFYPQIIK